MAPGGPGMGAFAYQTFTLGAFDNFNEGAGGRGCLFLGSGRGTCY